MVSSCELSESSRFRFRSRSLQKNDFHETDAATVRGQTDDVINAIRFNGHSHSLRVLWVPPSKKNTRRLITHSFNSKSITHSSIQQSRTTCIWKRALEKQSRSRLQWPVRQRSVRVRHRECRQKLNFAAPRRSLLGHPKILGMRRKRPSAGRDR
jgi:hypothetical protein